MALLTVDGISKQEGGAFVVKDIHFRQQPFEKIVIAGETGSGKTTLLKMIAGLVQPTTGEIRLHDERVKGPYEKLLPGHPKIAYLSQHFELRNNYRVEEELESRNEWTHADAEKLYAICRITHLLKRKTDQLSGGERQRIVLARLLSTSPELLLLDEPFSNLDAGHKQVIKSVIQDITGQLHTSCIMVSHDPLDTLPWADRMLIMKAGHIIQQGTPGEMYQRPMNEYVASLLGDYNLLDKNAVPFGLYHTFPEIENSFLIRPEQMVIDEMNYLFKAVIEKVAFFGSHYLLLVNYNNQQLKVRTCCSHFQAGDTVSLSLKTN